MEIGEIVLVELSRQPGGQANRIAIFHTIEAIQWRDSQPDSITTPDIRYGGEDFEQ